MHTITKRIAKISLGIHALVFGVSFATLAASFISGNAMLFLILACVFSYSIFNLYVLLSGHTYNFVVDEESLEETEDSTQTLNS